ncbi:hypothetical protein ACJX0J_018562, partial [Zea mays]
NAPQAKTKKSMRGHTGGDELLDALALCPHTEMKRSAGHIFQTINKKGQENKQAREIGDGGQLRGLYLSNSNVQKKLLLILYFTFFHVLLLTEGNADRIFTT